VWKTKTSFGDGRGSYTACGRRKEDLSNSLRGRRWNGTGRLVVSVVCWGGGLGCLVGEVVWVGNKVSVLFKCNFVQLILYSVRILVVRKLFEDGNFNWASVRERRVALETDPRREARLFVRKGRQEDP